MVPAPQSLVAGLSRLQPAMKRLALIWSEAGFEPYARAVRAEAAERGIDARLVRIADPGELPSRLRSLQGRVDALWLAPDARLVTPVGFATLRDFSRAARTPFYAPTAGLVREGATASVAPDWSDIGRAAAAAARRVAAGERVTEYVYAERAATVVGDAARMEGR